MLKKAHIFHHNDMDGKFAAFFLYQYLKKYERQYRKTEFYELDYSQDIDLDAIYQCDFIAFVDYSFSNPKNLEALRRAIKDGKRILWIDHHKTSIEALDALGRSAPYGECDFENFDTFFNDVFSATKLTYAWCLSRINKKPEDGDLFLGEEMPTLVNYVNAYDLWKHDLVYKCEEFNYGVQSSKYSPKSIYKDIFGDFNSKYNIFDMNDRYMLDLVDLYIKSKITIGEYIKADRNTTYAIQGDKMMFDISINDRINNVYLKGVAMNVMSNSSAFLDEYNKNDFVCPFYLTADGNWKYSLFSYRNDIRLDEYANALGKSSELWGISGGGHRSAAGFILKKLILWPKCTIEFSKTAITKVNKIRIV